MCQFYLAKHYFVCVHECFWMRVTFESADLVKQIAFANVDVPYPSSRKSESNKEPSKELCWTYCLAGTLVFCLWTRNFAIGSLGPLACQLQILGFLGQIFTVISCLLSDPTPYHNLSLSLCVNIYIYTYIPIYMPIYFSIQLNLYLLLALFLWKTLTDVRSLQGVIICPNMQVMVADSVVIASSGNSL